MGIIEEREQALQQALSGPTRNMVERALKEARADAHTGYRVGFGGYEQSRDSAGTVTYHVVVADQGDRAALIHAVMSEIADMVTRSQEHLADESPTEYVLRSLRDRAGRVHVKMDRYARMVEQHPVFLRARPD